MGTVGEEVNQTKFRREYPGRHHHRHCQYIIEDEGRIKLVRSCCPSWPMRFLEVTLSPTFSSAVEMAQNGVEGHVLSKVAPEMDVIIQTQHDYVK